MERPPAPGQRPPAPATSGRADKQGDRTGGRRPKLYPVRALLAIAVIGGLLVLYTGVRSARTALEGGTTQGPAGEKIELGEPMEVTLARPQDWKVAEQQAPADAVARYALGPAGTKKEAMFLTRYQLRQAAESDDERDQVRREAERSLRATGAPRSIKRLDDAEEIDDRHTWRYRYRQGKLQMDVALVLDGRALFQVACQSRRGQVGRELRAGCRAVERSLDLPG